MHILKLFFSLSASHTKHYGNSDASPPNWDIKCKWYVKNHIFDQYLALFRT